MPHDRLGWKKNGNYLIPPETFRTQFCGGRNVEMIIAELNGRRLLVKDRFNRMLQIRIYGERQRLYAISGRILTEPEPESIAVPEAEDFEL